MIDYDTKRLPFQPETLEAIKARFPIAIEREISIIDMALSLAGKGEVPAGLDRKFVFDFGDGIRMMATREDDRPAGRFIHLSFGVAHSRVGQWDNGSERGYQMLEARAKELTAELLPGRTPKYIQRSPRALHYYYEQ